MRTKAAGSFSARGETGNRGFTLVETMVGVAVLGICFISLYAGITFGISVVQASRESARATEILTEKLETIRLYTWTAMNSNGYVPATFKGYYDPYDSNVPPAYVGQSSILAGPGGLNYSPSLKTIQASVRWTNGNVVHSKSMMTYVSQYGLHSYE